MKLWTALFFLLSVSTTMTAQSGTSSEPDTLRISVLLNPTVHSEVVDIRYEMVGDFGGYYSFVRPQPDVHQYLIPASFENKPAREMTIVVYAPGCQFQALHFYLAVPAPQVNRQFDCRPLRTLSIAGYIDPRGLPSDRPLAIVAELEADWLCALFQLMDCLVPSVRLGQVGSIDAAARGDFEVSIPDFFADPLVNTIVSPTAPDFFADPLANAIVSPTAHPRGVGTVILVLRNELGQTVAAIRPKENTPENQWLTVQREYQTPTIFEKVRQAAAQPPATE